MYRYTLAASSSLASTAVTAVVAAGVFLKPLECSQVERDRQLVVRPWVMARAAA